MNKTKITTVAILATLTAIGLTGCNDNTTIELPAKDYSLEINDEVSL